MGSPVGEPGRQASGEDSHEVTLSSGFYMGIYEVTQELYEAVMLVNPSEFDSSPLNSETQKLRPVEMVTWFDAVEFCNTLSGKSNLQPVYTISGTTVNCDWGKNGYRLPTEAEWEYACRATATTAFNCGTTGYTDESDYTDIANPLAWWYGNSDEETHEVGKKAANTWGLFDMHGNVTEWCWDWYSATYYTTGVGAGSDPKGPDTGIARVARGGSMVDGERYLRSANRDHSPPGDDQFFIGFRLVRGQ
jgi:formylglycine-generating enzyme required for sulfatase activity